MRFYEKRINERGKKEVEKFLNDNLLDEYKQTLTDAYIQATKVVGMDHPTIKLSAEKTKCGSNLEHRVSDDGIDIAITEI